MDIFDQSGSRRHRAAQCKLHGYGKTIPFAEIEAELKRADTLTPRLHQYHLLTTGRPTPDTQKKVRQLNMKRSKKGRCQVFVLTWSDIQGLLAAYPEVRDKYYKTNDTRGPTPSPETTHDLATVTATAARAQVQSATAKLIEADKYTPELYVERAVEGDIHKFLNRPMTRRSPRCFLLIAPAGCGKTSLLCHVAEQSSQLERSVRSSVATYVSVARSAIANRQSQ